MTPTPGHRGSENAERARSPRQAVRTALTSRELAELLGVSAGTVLDWFEAGRLPGFKLGRSARFRASEVEAWLEAQRVGAAP